MRYDKHSVVIAVVFAAVVSFFCVGTLHAQTEKERGADKANSLADGAWAFQFQIDNNFTLRSFQGAIISLKRHYSPSVAIRLGTSLTFDVSDDDRSVVSLQADTIRESQTGTNSGNRQTIQLMAQYLYYPNPEALVNFFIGAGPLVQFSRAHEEYKQVRSSSGNFAATDNGTREAKSWAIGANALAGVEWFASKSLSFHAEYGLSIQYVSSKETSSNKSRTDMPPNPPFFSGSNVESSRKGWQVSGTSVKFGLSVYF